MTRLWILLGLAALIAATFVACQKAAEVETAAPAKAAEDPVARGKYLVSIMSCNDCHTPWIMGPAGQPVPDSTRFLSGHPGDMELPPPPRLEGPWMALGSASFTAWHGPWGISYAANLTPDSTTGLGVWTEDIFVKAMRTGRHLGTSRPILPPMPWTAMNHLTDDDLHAVWAYLQSIPAVENHVPDALLAGE